MLRVDTRRDLYLFLPAGIGAELGVLEGDNAADLLAIAKPRVLHLVDVWRPYTGGRIEEGQTVAFTVEGPDARGCVEDRFAAAIAAGQVVVHQADTVAWLARQPASSLDWLYLDSDHGEPHVTRELCQALRVVKAGGWICGHDYCSLFGGVVAAVDRFCALHGQTLAIVTDQPELPILPAERERLPWLPSAAACNSFAIQVEK
jgi:hypothetical protein